MKKMLYPWVEALAYAMVVLAFLYFIFWPLKVSGLSMEDTLQDGNRIAVSRVFSFFQEPSRGDIVVCRIKKEGKTEIVVKRVIGLPGEALSIHDGKVFINGNQLDEPYLEEDATMGNQDLVLEPGCYFIMGDNRGVSYDSRALGPVYREQIVGKVVMRWFPFNALKIY